MVALHGLASHWDFSIHVFDHCCRADLRTDGLIVLVATMGGLVIKAWGTQTNLWFYYTSERPPLWIIPAWPIATLSIDRITRALSYFLPKENKRVYQILYWLTFVPFYVLMLIFVAPTFNKPYTIFALLLCALLIIVPTDRRLAILVFVAGAGLGYFLELWGTTRQCWTYYTYQTPPLFAVLAHGMAAFAFWRTGLILKKIGARFGLLSLNQSKPSARSVTHHINSDPWSLDDGYIPFCHDRQLTAF